MVQTVNSLIKDIKNMKIRGAARISLESLKFLKTYSKDHTFDKKFFQVASKIEKARPTAVVFHNCIKILKKEKKKKTIDRLIRQIKDSKKKIAKYGSKFLKHKKTILTRCHSTEAISLIAALKPKHVYAMETLPHKQGLLTMKDLKVAKVQVTLIKDNQAEKFISKVDYIIIGSDALRKKGNVNKIKSYDLAVLAKKYKKSYYVAANILKIDKRKTFKIEKRKINNKIIPLFDITPWKYVTRIITDKGVVTPGNLKRMMK